MKKSTLLCATTNAEKFALGQAAFAGHGITLEQVLVDIDEIQGEDADMILHDKAKKHLLLSASRFSSLMIRGAFRR